VALGSGTGPDLAKSLKQGALLLKPGDSVILHSGGATESADPAAEAFGLKRLAEVIQSGPLRSAAEHVVEAVEAVLGHCKTAAAPEEITLLVLQRPLEA
jgi:serine phosphatase RsbU (regulator of sigma subunit)